MIDLETFQRLPTEEVARLVREAGPQVCVFPFDGTRRWLTLEYPEVMDFTGAYVNVVSRQMTEVFGLVFDHGVDTLVAPMVGPDLFSRGEAYLHLAAQMLIMFAQGQAFVDFYNAYDVRVRFYGDYQRYLTGTPCESALDAFEEVTRRTASHHGCRLFWGMFAQDATRAVAEFAVRFHREYGYLPDKRQIVEAYYGEYVEPVSFYIGFGKPAAFDMPLIVTGNEDLYFTVSPSPYLDQHMLRYILYDHLYVRPGEPEYSELTADDWNTIRQFYRLNCRSALGVGRRSVRGRIWFPVDGIQEPDDFERLIK
jgi:tuberculosinol/isotuberculosinol synthase